MSLNQVIKNTLWLAEMGAGSPATVVGGVWMTFWLFSVQTGGHRGVSTDVF